jgi:hypothetical protein
VRQEALGGRRYEVLVAPAASVDHLILGGGCSGCYGICPVPEGVSARVVAVEPVAVWSVTVTTPPTRVDFAAAGEAATFLLALDASVDPETQAGVDPATSCSSGTSLPDPWTTRSSA